jgi:hypothetical protein
MDVVTDEPLPRTGQPSAPQTIGAMRPKRPLAVSIAVATAGGGLHEE